MNRQPIYFFCGLITSWFILIFTLNKPKMWDLFWLPLLLGIVSGLLTTIIQFYYKRQTRLNRIQKELKKFEGNYQVFHWRDTINPDKCNYQISVRLDKDEASFFVVHKGKNDYDEWESKIKIEEMTFRYGEGNYKHNKKENTPTGRIQIYLIDDGIINVDKSYIDIKEGSLFVPEWEKWQWKKIS
jgi:hypothetical protein